MPPASYYRSDASIKQEKADNIKALAQVLRLSAGVGLTAFGIKGIHEMRKRLTEPELSGGPIDPRLTDSLLEYPVPAGTLRKKRPADAIQAKEAQSKKASISDWVAKNIVDALGSKEESDKPGLIGNILGSANPTNAGPLSETWSKRPWVFPAAAAGMSLSALGGWKAAKGIGAYLKNKDQEEQLQQAQKEYEEALLAQYRNRKSAGVGSYLGDKMNSLLGGYMLYASMMGIPAGVYAYNAHRTKNRKQLEEVLRQRAAMRAAESPAELYLVPEPYEPEDKPANKSKLF